MSFVTQYSDRIYGNITFIGNTLGLSRRENTAVGQSGQRVPGTHNIAGAFITTDTSSRCGISPNNMFPYGTTCSLPLETMYIKNSCEAVLKLPENAEIVYAELIWGGTYKYARSTVEARLNDPISFKSPTLKTPVNVYPLTATRYEYKMVQNAQVYAYTRSANVTNYVKQGGNGTYWVGKVPAVISADDYESNGFGGAGWTLAVIYHYQESGKPFRNVTLYVGGVPIIANTCYAEETLSRFVTPSQGPVNGRLLLSAFEGDHSLTGEQVFFATSGNGNLTKPLSGPNNLVNNFFASQINDDEGRLNTQTGTFCTRNHTLNGNAYVGFSGARQGWDITNIPIPSSHLATKKNSGTLRIATMGDSILLNAAAIVIDTNEPKLQITLKANAANAVKGDEVVYTAAIKNIGTAQAENILLKDEVPQEMSFVAGSVTIDQGLPTSYSPITGIPISILMPDAFITVQFKLKAASLSEMMSYENEVTADYGYYLQPEPYFAKSNVVTIYSVIPGLRIEKFADPPIVAANGTINYTIKISNTGTLPITDIKVYDTDIPQGLTVNESSLLVDGQKPVGNLKEGIVISKINKGAYSMIKFNASVSNILFAAFENTAYGSGSYTVNTGDIRPISEYSKSAKTDSVDVTLTHTVNKAQAIAGDALIYTITITNNSSITIKDVVLSDIIDPNTTYDVSNPIPYSELSSGITISQILGKDSAPNNVYSIDFKVNINDGFSGVVTSTADLKSYQYEDAAGGSYTGVPLQATALTAVQDIDVIFNSWVTPENAQVGDQVVYTMQVVNNSTTEIFDVLVKDASADLAFMTISEIMLNNKLLDPQPALSSGIAITQIPAATNAEITFKGTVLATASDVIKNMPTMDYSYMDGSKTQTVTGIPSREVDLNVIKPSLVVEKYADKAILINDGTVKMIQYTVYVKNTGNVALDNVVIMDSLPQGMTYQPNSTYINSDGPFDSSPEPAAHGISIGTIPPYSTVPVLFTVDVSL